jgi:PadR family transcriptional regulator PadR
MNAQLKKGLLEICVLIMIENSDKYGYELASNISSKIEIAEGTLYPLLSRLTKQGYFETYILESNEGPPRKYYRITQKGLDYLNQLIKEWEEISESINYFINLREKRRESL